MKWCNHHYEVDAKYEGNGKWSWDGHFKCRKCGHRIHRKWLYATLEECPKPTHNPSCEV